MDCEEVENCFWRGEGESGAREDAAEREDCGDVGERGFWVGVCGWRGVALAVEVVGEADLGGTRNGTAGRAWCGSR